MVASNTNFTKEPQDLWVFERNKLLILKSLFCCENHLCGSDFIDELDVPKNLVSYHLKTLREGGFVEEKQVGRNKNYQLTAAKTKQVIHILQAVDLLPEN